MSYWNGYFCEDFGFDHFQPGTRVLDVGCGDGHQMHALASRGVHVTGVDLCGESVRRCNSRGLTALKAPAERLPFEAGSFDGIICKVVLPYTDEARAIEEWARVLKRSGEVRACYHGSGYYLRYFIAGSDNWKERMYGARTLLNGWIYGLTQRRLPGFIGDTIFQTLARLDSHYRRAGLVVRQRSLGRTFGGFPVFIYDRLARQ